MSSVVVAGAPPAPRRTPLLVRLLREPAALVSAIVAALLVLGCALASLVAPYGNTESDFSHL